MEPTPEDLLEKIRPKHIDLRVMCEIVNESDDVDDIADHFEEWTDHTMDEIMDRALKSCMGLCTSIDPGIGLKMLMNLPEEDPTKRMEFYGTAFLTGLENGLEDRRGIGIPDSWTPQSKDFWDLNGKSVTWMSVQRALRAVSPADDDDENDPREEHPLIIMASIWMDAYVLGSRFDARKEVLIN